jgi:hypothetical protein
MQKTVLLLLAWSLMAAGVARGQGAAPYSTRWMVKPSVGYYWAPTKLLSGTLTDHLLDYDDETFYWQVVTATWFFHKHWGVEFNYQAGGSPRLAGRADRFTEAVRAQYGDRYIVTASTGADYPESNLVLGHVQRGFLGVAYRLENRRLLAYPKLAVGVTSFYTDWGRAYLKEKNTNRVYEVFWSTGARANDFLSLAASGTLAYKLRKRVYLNLDLQGTYYKANFTYSKLLKDLANSTTETEYIPYRKDMINIGVGGGVIVVLK